MRSRWIVCGVAACLCARTLTGCFMIPLDPSPEDYYIEHADQPDELSRLSYYRQRYLVLGFYPGIRAGAYHGDSFGELAGTAAIVTLFNCLFLIPTVWAWLGEAEYDYDGNTDKHDGMLAVFGYFKTRDHSYRYTTRKALEPYRTEGLQRIEEGEDPLEVARDIGDRSGMGTSNAIVDLYRKSEPVAYEDDDWDLYDDEDWDLYEDDYAPAVVTPKPVSPAERHYRDGTAWLQKQDYDRAAAEFRQAIGLDPDHSEYRNGLGVCLLKSGRVAEAVSSFDRALDLDPKSPLALKNRAIANMQLRRFDPALADLATLLEVSPKSAEAYVLRATIRAESGDCGRAVPDFNEAIRLDARSAEAYYGRGVCRAAANDLGPAIADFTEAIRCRDDYVEAYHNRAVAYLRLGSQAAALTDLNKAIEIRPTAESLVTRGSFYASLGATKNALDDLSQAIELSPGYGQAYYQRAFLHHKQGEEAKAAKDLRQARDLGVQVDSNLLEVLELQDEWNRQREE